MIARYTSSLGFAGFVTLILLYLMQQMIAMGRPVLGDRKGFRLIPFVTVVRPPQVVQTRHPPERHDPAPQPPRPTVERGGGSGPRVSPTPPVEPSFEPPGPSRSILVDGDVLPIVKVAPTYPEAAIQRNLEGRVIVEFTITRTGSVSDVFVVESTHPIFERPAIDAAAKFRYRPRVIDGTPVAVHGVRHLITFSLDD